MNSSTDSSHRDEKDPSQRGLVFVLGSSSGGVVRHVAQLASELAARVGDDTPIRVSGPVDHAVIFQDFPYRTVPIGAAPHPRDLKNIGRLRKLLNHTAVVHAHGLRAGAMTVLAAKTLRKSRRPRIVVTLHNVAVGSRGTKWISSLLESIVARGADVTLGVSSDIVASVRMRGARESQRALIPAPHGVAQPQIDADQVRARLGIPSPTKILLTVARLAPQKGLDTLLNVAEQLANQPQRSGHEEVEQFLWLIAGDGPVKGELAAQIQLRGLPVRLLGPRRDVPDLLAAADIVVSTAVWEGQPIGIQEALHAGAAIVATDAGGTREVTGPSGAVIVPVGAVQRLVESIRELLQDEAACARQGAAAYQRAQQLPGPAEMAQQVLRAYGWSQFLS